MWLRFLVLASILGLATAADPAAAQIRPIPRGMQQPQFQAQTTDISGTVEGYQNGVLAILSDRNQPVYVKILPASNVKVTGKASADFLTSGHCIQFVAEVDKKHNRIEETVGKLTLTTPTHQEPLGAFTDTGAGDAGDAEGKPGEKPRLTGDDAPPKRPTPRPAAPKAKANDSGLETFTIRASITSLKNGKAVLQLPTRHFKSGIKVDIAPDAQVDVDLRGPSGLTYARKGDKVKILGMQLGPNLAQAMDVQVTLANVLEAAPGKRKPAGKDAAETSKRGKERDDGGADEGKAAKGKPAAKRGTKPATDPAAEPAEEPEKPAKPAKPAAVKPAIKPAPADDAEEPTKPSRRT
jgi:hypothetical protein